MGQAMMHTPADEPLLFFTTANVLFNKHLSSMETTLVLSSNRRMPATLKTNALGNIVSGATCAPQ